MTNSSALLSLTKRFPFVNILNPQSFLSTKISANDYFTAIAVLIHGFKGVKQTLAIRFNVLLTEYFLSYFFKLAQTLELRWEIVNSSTKTVTLESPSKSQHNFKIALSQAIEQEQFVLNYQPQIDLETGQLLGVESLIRWQHPHLGTVSPTEFIPIAEETGLIVPIGHWVLRQSCLQYQKWRASGVPAFKLSVNLSIRQLEEPNLLTQIKAILQETKINPAHLSLEVTESLVLNDPATAIARLTELQQLGLHIAIDDFGTGYSSLSFLKDLPVHILKIDKSFLHDLINARKNQLILQSIIELSHRLKLKIIAEGIENHEQFNLLKLMNCDYGQGYFFSRPLGLSDITRYFHKANLGSHFTQPLFS